MAESFTIFNHGTGSHRSRTDGEIVAEFGRAAAGTEYSDYLITDGPGSDAADGGAVADPSNPMPGTFDPYTRDKAAKSVEGLKAAGFKVGTGIKLGLKDPKFMSMSKPSTLSGGATGKGWDDNVIHAIAAISELPTLPKTINMIGWSRGAVTCTKVAYKLADIYPQVAVNIFAVDPVAGLGNKSDADASELKVNVRNYIGILAMDEARTNFEPQDQRRLTISKMTNAIFLPFPGRHNTSVRLNNSPPESAQMVWSLASRFLTHFGSRFSRVLSPIYSGQEVCNAYGKIRISRADYHALRQRWYKPPVSSLGGKIQPREFLSSIDNYVVDADYFINEHHRESFIRTYPKVYTFLFEGKTSDERQVWQEFKSMYNLTGLMNSLGIFGVKRPDPGHPFVLPYPGSGHKRGGMKNLQARGSLLSMGLF